MENFMTDFAQQLKSVVQVISKSYNNQATHLLQMLWQVQQKYSYISDDVIDLLAEDLNLSRAHVQGVAEFYSFFHRTPRGEYDIYFSDNIIEHMQGKHALQTQLLEKLKVKLGKPRADGRVTVDNTACIGMSDQGPAMLVNGLTITRLTPQKIDLIAELVEQQKPLREWPCDWFDVKENIQRKHILLGENFEPGSAIQVVLNKGSDGTLREIEVAGLRGCGGAGFPTHKKWLFCRDTVADERIVICNADEGEPGTFKDRVLLQSYADLVFEGMTVCAATIGAKKGFLYLRGEYRYLQKSLETVLAKRREAGLLGENILGQEGFDFDIEIHLGAGAYICGAELALIESLEGNRGIPRKHPPPYPVNAGYLDKPTVVNNVETFALAAKIMVYTGKRFATLGTDRSKGTKLISVSGDCDRPGVYEVPFGITVREMLDMCGAQNVQAVQNSGPAGVCISADEFDHQLCFEDLNSTGSFMIFGQQRDMLEVIRNFTQFFVHESCGFCTPCRVGTSVMKNLVDKIHSGHGTKVDLQDMENLSHIMKTMSNCGLGLTASNAVADTLKKFPQVYEERLQAEVSLAPSFDLDAALEAARQVVHRDDETAHIAA